MFENLSKYDWLIDSLRNIEKLSESEIEEFEEKLRKLDSLPKYVCKEYKEEITGLIKQWLLSSNVSETQWRFINNYTIITSNLDICGVIDDVVEEILSSDNMLTEKDIRTLREIMGNWDSLEYHPDDSLMRSLAYYYENKPLSKLNCTAPIAKGKNCYVKCNVYQVQQRSSQGRRFYDYRNGVRCTLYIFDKSIELVGDNGHIVVLLDNIIDISLIEGRPGEDFVPLLSITPKNCANIYIDGEGMYGEGYADLAEIYGTVKQLINRQTDNNDLAASHIEEVEEKVAPEETPIEPTLKHQSVQQNSQKDFTESPIYLQPWIGADYEYGINGHKVLVLGASHYAQSEEWNPEFTIQMVRDYYLNMEVEREPWMRTYTKFERALAGYEVPITERNALWDKFMFWNFIQEPMNGPNKSQPSDDAIYRGQDAFLEILSTYQPDRIIVWGDGLYGWLPDRGQQGDTIKLQEPWKDGKFYEIETWEYPLPNGLVCKVLPITHPARDFAWDYYHLFIKQLLL